MLIMNDVIDENFILGLSTCQITCCFMYLKNLSHFTFRYAWLRLSNFFLWIKLDFYIFISMGVSIFNLIIGSTNLKYHEIFFIKITVYPNY